MKMIDYRLATPMISTCRFFLERRTAFFRFLVELFSATETGAPVDCRWIVGRETDRPAGSIIVSVPPRFILEIDIR
jgi:hypothetical protein